MPKVLAMPNDLHDLISTAEACALLDGLHPSTISRWVQLGRLTPARRVGTAFLFRRADVEALAAPVAP